MANTRVLLRRAIAHARWCRAFRADSPDAHLAPQGVLGALWGEIDALVEIQILWRGRHGVGSLEGMCNSESGVG